MFTVSLASRKFATIKCTRWAVAAACAIIDAPSRMCVKPRHRQLDTSKDGFGVQGRFKRERCEFGASSTHSSARLNVSLHFGGRAIRSNGKAPGASIGRCSVWRVARHRTRAGGRRIQSDSSPTKAP